MSGRMIAIRFPGWPAGVDEDELRHDEGLAERLFQPVLAALEEVTPGIESLRPGLCVLRGRGPTRYYGGEEAAAAAIRSCVDALGVGEASIGIADGVFAAEQATRISRQMPNLHTPTPGLGIVPPGKTAAFLSPLPIDRAAAPELVVTFRGLGIRTLGQLAALPEHAVRDRFGPAGLAAHRRARAAAPVHGAEFRARQAVRDFGIEFDFEPPVSSAEQLAFACAQLAEQLIDGLAEQRLVCTTLRIELTDDIGVRHERLWEHSGHFTASDVVNRVRWQVDTMMQRAGGPVSQDAERGGAGITHIRLSPAHTDRIAAHEPALWSTGPDERVHHRFTQLQSRLGHAEVGTAQLGGGRLLSERQQLVPWGTRAAPRRPAHGPWPGALPGPLPSTVFPTPIRAALTGVSGAGIGIDADDLLDGRPTQLRVDSGAPTLVTDWSLPWPLRELWWEGRPERWRMQVQTSAQHTGHGIGSAWLLVHQNGQWFAEGRYA